MIITREKFKEYQTLKDADIITMDSPTAIAELTGLDKKEAKYIRDHYSKLSSLYLEIGH